MLQSFRLSGVFRRSILVPMPVHPLICRIVLVTAMLLSPTLYAAQASVEMLTGACVACHGPAGNSLGPATPNLAGQPSVYFIGAMLSYKYPADLEAARDVVNGDPALEDVEIFERHGTIMNRIAPGYTLDEIKAMAHHFEDLGAMPAVQAFDPDRAHRGEALHEEHCEKCHEDGGQSTEDDMARLAGQWKPYLHYSLDDFHDGVRGMPKKMKKQLNEAMERAGDDGLIDLIHYYASQQ